MHTRTLLSAVAGLAVFAGAQAPWRPARGPDHDPRQPGVIRTIAGGGPAAGTAAPIFLNLPGAVAVAPNGDVYILAAQSNRIFKLEASGRITVVAGTGAATYTGDGGPAARATFDFGNAFTDITPSLALDAAGDLYIPDVINNVVRRVSARTGIIATIAGNGTCGYTGDGGPAISAELCDPQGLALDQTGNLFIADANSVIRRVDAATGVITTVVGTGTAGYAGDGGPAAAAKVNFNSGVGIAFDAAGNLYVADTGNSAMRVVTPAGVITTVANHLKNPSAVLPDNSGHLYIADAFAILSLNLSSGVTTVVAGQEGAAGFSGDGGPATAALLDLSQNYLPAMGSLALDAAGNLYIPDADNNRVRVVDTSTGIIRTLAGGGSGGDGGPARRAVLGFVPSMILGNGGDLLLSEADARVRKFPLPGGPIQTIVGTGRPTIAPANPGTLPALQAVFGSGIYISPDSHGNLFMTDVNNNRVWRVDALTGTLTLFAGAYHPNLAACAPGALGDGGPAVNACLYQPRGVAVDEAGNVYIAETSNYRIRKVAPSGIISTIAGIGKSSCFGDGGPATAAGLGSGGSGPTGVALDAAGNIYFADCDDIRRIDAGTGIISTVAGNGSAAFNVESGPALSVALGNTRSPLVDAQGNLWIADAFMNRIRRLDAFTGILSTIAGSGGTTLGTGGYTGDGGIATQAQLNAPYGLVLDGNRLLIGDSGNYVIREVDLPPFAGILPGALEFGAQSVGAIAKQTITIKSTGSSTLHLRDPRISGPDADSFDITASTCGDKLRAGRTCTITVAFRPRVPGAVAATLDLPSDAVFSPQSVPLGGAGAAH